MTPEEFFKLCEAHDWDYHNSDDPQAYRAGSREFNHLMDLADQEPRTFPPIYGAWFNYRRHGGPKPQLSDFVPQNQTPLTGQKDTP